MKKLFLMVLLMSVVLDLFACKKNANKNTVAESFAMQQDISVNETKKGIDKIAETKETHISIDDLDIPKTRYEDLVDPTVVAKEVAKYPLTIEDMVGRKVVVKNKPEKIVCSYDTPAKVALSLGYPERIINDVKNIVGEKPDIVIVSKDEKDLEKELTKQKLKVVMVSSDTQEEVVDMMLLLSKITDNTEDANKFLNSNVILLNNLEVLIKGLTQDEKRLIKNPKESGIKMPEEYEDWGVPGVTGVLGMYYVLNRLHNEIYNDSNFMGLVNGYYLLFLGYDPDFEIKNYEAIDTKLDNTKTDELQDKEVSPDRNVYGEEPEK